MGLRKLLRIFHHEPLVTYDAAEAIRRKKIVEQRLHKLELDLGVQLRRKERDK